MIISNTSPLYYLHQVGLLDVLNRLFGRIHTTPEVIRELEAGKAQGLSIPDLSEFDGFIIRDIAVPSFLELIPDLGLGEASIIALSLENPGSRLIIDDHLARDVARSQRIDVTGTLGVLLLAKEQGLIESVGVVMEALLEYGFYCRSSVAAYVLKLARE